jgi:hypothetical protein
LVGDTGESPQSGVSHEEVTMSGKKSNRSGRSTNRGPEISSDEWIEVLRTFYRRRHRQKVIGWCLVGLAGVIALQHFLRHVNTVDVTPFLSIGLQDVVIGYPMAGVMLLIAVVLLGQSDEPPRRAAIRHR